MTGQQIRQFLRELFGSRVIAHLEETLLRQRDDSETRLRDREIIIAEQRERIGQLEAKIAQYEMVLLPMVYGTVLKPKKTPNFDPITEPSPLGSWAEIQAENDRVQREEAEKERTNGGRET